MNGVVTGLFHYPIKGLSAQVLESVPLREGRGFPWDRVFGFARHDSGYDPAHFSPLPKQRFLVLANEARLAELDTFLDVSALRFTVKRGGAEVFRADLSTAGGRDEAVDFFSGILDLGETERPVFADGGDNRFTDVSVVSKEMMNAVSLINLDSVAALEEQVGQPVDPRRFRGNICFRGWSAFSELDLVGEEVVVGSARLRLCRRTRRCAATEVNPDTAERDLPVPRLIHQTYGHADMGIYGEVIEAGLVRTGDSIVFPESNAI